MTFSSDKDKYVALGEAHPEWPVFMQAWWLDAACGGREKWSCILLLDSDGRAVGAHPFFLKKKWGISQVRLPPLTPWLGIWFNRPLGSKPASLLSAEIEFFSKMIKKLPNSTYFLVNFHWSVTNWLPFHWARFDQTTRVTHLLDCSKGVDFLWKNFRHNIRKNIQKAGRQVQFSATGELQEVFFLLKKTFARKNLNAPFDFLTLEKLDFELEKRGQRKIFFARDADNRLHAAVYLIWDATSANVLLTVSDPDLRKSSAVNFLYFEVIKFLAETDGLPKLLDFEGSMLEEVEIVYRSFGAEQRLYPQFFRAKNKFWHTLYLLFKK